MTAPVRIQAQPGATPLGLIFGTMVVLIGIAVSLTHADSMPFVFCVFKRITGLPCMTCGTTRAFGELAQLDVRGALMMNPLTASAALLFLPWSIADLALLPRGRALRLSIGRPWHDSMRVAAIVLVILNWAYLVAAGR